ncbi:hypothetical protein M3X99_09360 [Clostridium perfringens]|uniref:hypothetical protein n=1 Tax=Clostridium perfringens TaxID=1502 RepID=UPI002341C4E7|nr:hypothetical protein [Clostridium perfringens]MDC4251226.1 hypothetical protein [Clostridium perfringens]
MNRIYWKLRKRVKNIIFKIKIFLFKNKDYIYDKKLEGILYFSLLKEVLKQIFINLIIIVITFYIDLVILHELNNRIVIDNDLLFNLLVAMLGIAGVFLGLYCSNIMSIFSTRYVNAPKNLTKLFENDLLTNRSIHSITSYLIFAVIILIFDLCGKQPGIFFLIICGIRGIKIIVSYSLIGGRTFQLADTYKVVDFVYKEIYKNFEFIKGENFFSQDINFQNYCKERTQKLLEALKEINSYNIESKEFRSASMEEFMTSNLKLINYYWKIKSQIPYDSYWYDKKKVYKKWYSASDTEVMSAINTGNSIGYRIENDYEWFEKSLMDLNKSCLEIITNSIAFSGMYKWLMKIKGIGSSSIEAGNLTFYLKNINELQDNVVKLVNDNGKLADTSEEMALVEVIMIIYINIIIEMKKYIQNIDIENILNSSINYSKISNINFRNKYYNYEDIVKLYSGIHVELKLEKKQITPNWYIKQVLAKHIHDDILNLYFRLDKIVNCYVPKFSNELLENKKYASTMIVYSKMSEMKSEIKGLLSSLKVCLVKLESYHIEKSIVWGENPSDDIEKKIVQNFREIPTKWSKCASAFTLYHWKEYNNFPDLLGECYNYVCEFLIESLEKMDFSSFSEVYKNLWKLAILYQEKIREDLIKTEEYNNKDGILVAYSSTIVEYGYISGYAYILGEIIGDEKWKDLINESFKEVIKNSLEKNEELCEKIIVDLNIPNSTMPFIYNRDLIHTDWKQRIEFKFRNLDCLKWRDEKFMKVLVTESNLLKAIIGYFDDLNFLHCEAYEVFAVEVVNKYLPVNKRYVSRTRWEKKLDYV